MALNPVPQPGQSLNATQAPILNNFAIIDAGFSVNHVAFGAPGVGQHKNITFPAQVAASIPATDGTHAMLYVANNSSAHPALFFKPYSTAIGNTGIDFTTAGFATNFGWCQLPSGMIFSWGTSSIANGAANPLTINTGGMFPNNIFAVQLTLNNAALNNPQLLTLSSIPNNTSFIVLGGIFNAGHYPIDFGWLAIGN